MHTTIVTMRDGSTVSGVIWKWRPLLGFLDLAGVEGHDDPVRLRFDDVLSAVTPSDRVGPGRIGDVDEMARYRDHLAKAKEYGWTEADD